MNEEKLKETRMKIAYNILQGWAASGDLSTNKFKQDIVADAYEIADEVLKQGGYDA